MSARYEELKGLKNLGQKYAYGDREVMDTYTLEKITGWTPELAPPKDSPLFRWRVLA